VASKIPVDSLSLARWELSQIPSFSWKRGCVGALAAMMGRRLLEEPELKAQGLWRARCREVAASSHYVPSFVVSSRLFRALEC